MRLHLQLSPSRQPVNFDHLPVLAGALHKWLGPNEEHDELSLYSFSWLQGAKPGPGGLQFPKGATWFISSLDNDFLIRSIQGVLANPEVRWGMRVQECRVSDAPAFPAEGEIRFLCASPIFIKRSVLDDSRPGWPQRKILPLYRPGKRCPADRDATAQAARRRAGRYGRGGALRPELPERADQKDHLPGD